MDNIVWYILKVLIIFQVRVGGSTGKTHKLGYFENTFNEMVWYIGLIHENEIIKYVLDIPEIVITIVLLGLCKTFLERN